MHLIAFFQENIFSKNISQRKKSAETRTQSEPSWESWTQPLNYSDPYRIGFTFEQPQIELSLAAF